MNQSNANRITSLPFKIIRGLWFEFVSLCYRVKGISVGKRCRISLSSSITGKVALGDNVTIARGVVIKGNVRIGENSYIADYAQILTMPDGRVIIGNNVLVNRFNQIGSGSELSIGNHCLFATGVKITNGTHKYDLSPDTIIKESGYEYEVMTIGSNCWLGFDVCVIKGGSVGDNCIIGAKSLVNSPIDSNSIAFGIPAQIHSKR
jgi:acetyltransferase-like isoleucine patch superfamily enzyme